MALEVQGEVASKDVGSEKEVVVQGNVDRSRDLLIKDLCIQVGDLRITEVNQLADGRIEVKFTSNIVGIRGVDEDMAYLACRSYMELSHTLHEARTRDDSVHYLFSDDGSWNGIRCPKDTWRAYMMAKDVPPDMIRSFLDSWTSAPMKTLVDRELVEQAKLLRPWENKA